MGTFASPGFTRTYDRGAMRIDLDGTTHVHVEIKNEAGSVVDRFEVRIPVAGAITDQGGNQLAASVPVGIANARASLLSAIDSAIDNAAAAGKFAR